LKFADELAFLSDGSQRNSFRNPVEIRRNSGQSSGRWTRERWL